MAGTRLSSVNHADTSEHSTLQLTASWDQLPSIEQCLFPTRAWDSQTEGRRSYKSPERGNAVTNKPPRSREQAWPVPVSAYLRRAPSDRATACRSGSEGALNEARDVPVSGVSSRDEPKTSKQSGVPPSSPVSKRSVIRSISTTSS